MWLVPGAKLAAVWHELQVIPVESSGKLRKKSSPRSALGEPGGASGMVRSRFSLGFGG
jgi:hypothetical protein